MLTVEDYRTVVPDRVLAEIYAKARPLYGKHVAHINSTYQGGGVAEILSALVPLMNDVGVNAGWRILHGNPDFFGVTKKFHNALQGNGINLTKKKKDLYLETNESFARFTHIDHDCIIIHDPQPLPLIKFYRKRQPWVWRCHIDLTHPNLALWDYLKNFLLKYDEVIISSEEYAKDDLPLTQRVICPAIDPLSLKNRDLPLKTSNKYITRAGIPMDKPYIAQVSRLDPWKDPEGVIDIFQRVREHVDCRLVLCYNTATDDPEGISMFNKVERKGRKLIDAGDLILVVGDHDILVNSVQRHAAIIIQKSIREGFCLAVTEALWKAVPVVGSRIGGIPLQIDDAQNGFLLDPHDVDGFADRVIHLLKNPRDAKRMGLAARETVREKFLITRLLSDYLDLIADRIRSRDGVQSRLARGLI